MFCMILLNTFIIKQFITYFETVERQTDKTREQLKYILLTFLFFYVVKHHLTKSIIQGYFYA